MPEQLILPDGTLVEKDDDGNITVVTGAASGAASALNQQSSSPSRPVVPSMGALGDPQAASFAHASGRPPQPEAERRGMNAITSAAIAGPFGGAAAGMAGAGELLSDTENPAQEAGAAGLGSLAEAALNRFRRGAGTAARVGARAAGEALGFGGGGAMSRLAEEQLLGKRHDTPNGTFFMEALPVGVLSLGFGGAAVGMRKLAKAPQTQAVRALNRLENSPENAGIDFGAGAAERVGFQEGGVLQDFFASKAKLGRLNRGAEKFIDRHFPVEWTPEQFQTIRESAQKGLVAIRDSFGPRGRGVPGAKKAFGDFLEGTGLKASEAEALFKELTSQKLSTPEQFLRTIFGKSDADAVRHMSAFKALSEILGEPELFDKVSNEYLRRELLGKSMVKTAQGRAGEFFTAPSGEQAVLNGKQFFKRISDIGVEKLNKIYGEGRGEALRDLARFMEISSDPKQLKANTTPRGIVNYIVTKAAFTFTFGGIAAVAGQLPETVATGATLIAVSMGAAHVVKSVLNKPQLAKMALETLEASTGQTPQAFFRALLSAGVDPLTPGQSVANLPPSVVFAGGAF